jgi:small subunit ribosomal protein S6
MNLRDYELMFIVRPTVTEEQLPGVLDRLDALIGSLGGEVRERHQWGKRRLAYAIQDHDDGYYVVAQIKLDPTRTRDLEEQLRISDEVIRHILVSQASKTRAPQV